MPSIRNPRRRPTHPGEILREDVLPALGITQTELAKQMGVSRLSVSEIVNEKRGVSPDMAIRIGRLTKTTPESWLNMQQALDLWVLESDSKRYRDLKPLAFGDVFANTSPNSQPTSLEKWIDR